MRRWLARAKDAEDARNFRLAEAHGTMAAITLADALGSDRLKAAA
jgi:hypothetical protein